MSTAVDLRKLTKRTPLHQLSVRAGDWHRGQRYNHTARVRWGVEHSAVKVWILLHVGLILHGKSICSLGYFPFQPVVWKWSIKGCGMCCCVCAKVHIKDPMLFIRKSSLYGESGFPLKKYVRMTTWLMSNSWWYENQWALEALLSKTNIPFAEVIRGSLVFQKWGTHADPIRLLVLCLFTSLLHLASYQNRY